MVGICDTALAAELGYNNDQVIVAHRVQCPLRGNTLRVIL